MKKSLKCDAQEALMEGLQVRLSIMCEDDTTLVEYQEAVRQFRRIERLFGYTKGVWKVGV